MSKQVKKGIIPVLCVCLLASWLGIFPAVAAGGVTQWKSGDALPAGVNRLASATTVTEQSSNGNPKLTNAVTALVDGDASTVASFYAFDYNQGYTDVTAGGKTITDTTGWAQLTMALSDFVKVDSVTVIGNNSGNAAGTWSYAGEDTARGYWGDAIKLQGGRYYAATPAGEIRTFNDKNPLYYEVYVSPYAGDLYDPSNRVLAYDNTTTLYLGATHKLDEPKVGAYIGLRVTTGTTFQARLGYFGVFGEDAENPDAGITKWSKGDALPKEDNLLTTAEYLAIDTHGNSISSNRLMTTTPQNLTDGDAVSKGTFYAKDYEDGYPDAKRPDGSAITGTTGWAQFAYDLHGFVSIEKVMLLGSVSDGAANSWSYADQRTAKGYWGDNMVLQNGRYYAADPQGKIRTFDDRHIQYYEIYVADSPDDLFDASHLILSYDNTRALMDGAIHTVDAMGSYIGFRMTTGTTFQSRIGEVGIYGKKADKTVTHSVDSAIGTVSVSVEAKGAKDLAVLDALFGGVRVTEVPLASGTPANVEKNRFAVKGTVAYKVELLDKSGAPLPDDGGDDAALAGRCWQVVFPGNIARMEIPALYENGTVTRLVNAYQRADGKLVAGTLNYPIYPATTANNRENAVLTKNALSFVLLTPNDLQTINALNGDTVNTPLGEFTPEDVAGAAETPLSWLWAIVPAAVLLTVTVLWVVRRRKGVR